MTIKSLVALSIFPCSDFLALKFSMESWGLFYFGLKIFLRPVLSSIITAETPRRSKVFTVNVLKCSALPPVSHHVDNWFGGYFQYFVQCNHARRYIDCPCSVFLAVESVRLLHMPSNSRGSYRLSLFWCFL